MRRLAFAVLAAALALALVPAAALGKGPIEASINGPGLEDPITFGGWDAEAPLADGAPLMEFAEAAGFFPAAFARIPDPMLDRAPKGGLGPRYVVTYVVPGPNNEEDRVAQDLYPYAEPNPVTYMAPGQTLFGTQATRGGWFVAASPAAPPLMSLLVDAGFPRNPPTGTDGSPFPWTLPAVLVATGALLTFGALAVVLIRRRLRPATT
jgi:hypothetical protein